MTEPMLVVVMISLLCKHPNTVFRICFLFKKLASLCSILFSVSLAFSFPERVGGARGRELCPWELRAQILVFRFGGLALTPLRAEF